MHIVNLTALVLLFTLSAVPVVQAQCAVDSNALYNSFKSYREKINSATRLDDLTPFFTGNFNNYYTSKLETAADRNEQRQYLNQYWNNLNTAKDIVIVYHYTASCRRNSAELKLISVLNPLMTNEKNKLALWKVIVHYRDEKHVWKINSFEYRKLNSRKRYREVDIKDNFVKIR